jgi:alkyl hydroperoxide reductase subunit F
MNPESAGAQELFDVIIIGCGPAGMTAAIYAVRKNMSAIVLGDELGGQAAYSSEVENYLGYTHISGAELVEKFEAHVSSFGIRREYGRAAALRTGKVFEIVLEDGNVVTGRSVIIASGRKPRRMGVPGEDEYAGRGVMFCATCDGPMFAGMDVAVVGGGNSGLMAAIQLQKICPKVYLIEIGPALRADEVYLEKIKQMPNIEPILNASVKRVYGEKLLKGIEIEDNATRAARDLSVNGVFVEIGSIPAIDFARGVVQTSEMGEIIVDCACRTDVPGIFAAGDVTTVPEKQIIVAAGEGAKAALSAYRYVIRSGD